MKHVILYIKKFAYLIKLGAIALFFSSFLFCNRL